MLFQDPDIVANAGGWFMIIVLFVVMLLILVLALKIGIGAVKGRNTEFGEVFVTALIMMVISAVLSFLIPFGALIAFIIWLFVIQSRHGTTILGALGALILALIMLVVILFLIGMVFVGLFAGFLALLSL